MRKLRRTILSITAILAVMAAVGIVASSALAGNAHFIKSQSGASISSTGALTCFFKEAGLESGSVETITCSATAETTYECVNGGGKNPSASNKTTTQTDIALTGDFAATQNGNVIGSLSGGPPSAADLGFSCPNGQTVTFVSVIYSVVGLSDADSGATLDISGTFSFTNPDAP
jgi:hypothetical protein